MTQLGGLLPSKLNGDTSRDLSFLIIYPVYAIIARGDEKCSATAPDPGD